MKGYKVTKLVCENHGIFNSQNLEIDGKNMIVEGKTGKGKTTLISLLSKIINKDPNIKMGASKETLQAFLKNDEGETLILKRVNTPKTSTPTFIDSSTGEKLSHKDVEGLMSDLNQDPLGLLRKTGQERFEFLLKCSNVDTKKLNGLKSERELRASDRKESKRLSEWLLDSRGEEPEKVDRIDISSQNQVIQDAFNHNQKIKNAISEKEKIVDSISYSLNKIEDLKKALKYEEIALKDNKERLEKADEWLLKNFEIDVEAMQEEVSNASAQNQKAAAYEKWVEKNNEYIKENNNWCNLNEEVKKLDSDIKSLTDEIEFPLEGVSINGSDIYYNDIKYDSLGTSDQILISSTLVAKYIVSQRKAINLMVIDRAESMDIETQAKVIEECNKIGVQLFLSIVDRKTDCESFTIDYLEYVK